ncbi:putative oxidoreductase [Auricularia subglabra TFB-10046 SS5]|nr:putative oxidoreductase [Auricularia subglabra TFB-10046 SS5]
MPPTVIITGASRGIGLAAARFLLADGAQVMTVQRTITPELSALVEQFPKTLHNVQGDCAAQDDIVRTIEDALRVFGGIGAVVFNAATFARGIGPVASVPVEAWQQTFDTNVFGVVRFLREVLPHMKAGAKLVFITSVGAEVGVVASGAYSASKAALNSINRTIAVERPDLVCVALHPGQVGTEMQKDFTAQAKDFMPESALAELFAGMLGPDVPGRVIATLALRARPELSGRYLHWNDSALGEL